MSRQNCSFAPTVSASARCRRYQFRFAILASAMFIGLMAYASPAQGQEPLSIFRNYFVTGDYAVGGVGLQGLGDSTGFATGTINIPDLSQPNHNSVPAGADIVAAFLYWQTVESAKFPLAGQNGSFNGFPIMGTSLPSSSQAPVSWSTGGCSGSANGTKFLNTYRADVRPDLPIDPSTGRVTTGNGSFIVQLRDSGSNGGGVPLTLGATLVIIYRVLSPATPLKSIVIYDGDFAPVNQGSTMVQDMQGFYDVADSPAAEITQIVGNGQANKLESVYLNGINLPSLYGTLPPFPGKYNGSWDNPTWLAPAGSVPPGGLSGNTLPVTSSVVPNSSNSGCVVWGAVIFGTNVRDTDNDGLLDSWETNFGYTDLITGHRVPLPGADPNTKDVYVDLDYLTDLDASVGGYAHSHLPKQQAIDAVGAAFASAPIDWDPVAGKYKGVHVHFDLGGDAKGHQIYSGDTYVLPDTASNAIPESTLLCQNSATQCEFPNQVAVGWKTGLLYVEDAAASPGTSTTPPTGYFDPGRKDSYHYVLFGHALGLPLSWWTAFGATTNNPTVAQLTSISVLNNTAKITLQTPASCAGAMPSPCYVYPGAQPAPGSPGFGDTNLDRITITDAINVPALNGTYIYSNPSSATSNSVTTTTFTITTTGVPDGTYTFSNEPRLAVLYAGPSSSSGHSDIGGADSLITFGLWPADDNPGCQPDPAAVPAGQSNYCDNQVGNVQAQAGTLMHELGHSFSLTHGGTYPQNYPASPLTYGVNCKPNYESVMNYLFQVRGFPEGSPIDYSRQSLQNLYEDTLSESTGIGADSSGKLALHATRWFAPPNSFDLKLGNRTATVNCDGSPLIYGEAGEVRVDNGPGYPGVIAAGTNVTNSSPIDWNNDLMTPDAVTSSIDVNLDGLLESASSSPNPPSPMVGFNDWQNIDFRQIGARAGGAGYSGGVGLTGGGGVGLTGGGGVGLTGGGGTPSDLSGGGGVGLTGGGGVGLTGGGGVGVTGGGGVGLTGGGGEVDFDLANSTVDAPAGLTAKMGSKAVVLNWNAPPFGQIRSYLVYRLVGLFDPNSSDKSYNPLTNAQLITTLKGIPPTTMYTDSTVKNKTTYTYFVVAALGDGRQSNVSNGAVINVVF